MASMKIGLIDVDGHNSPNLALMRISAYHKAMPYIQCGNLNSTGKDTECYAQLQPWRYKTADEAAEAWNRRDM